MRPALLASLLLLPGQGLLAQKAAADEPLGGGQRLTHAEWSAMPTPEGVSFATGVIGYSSQYSDKGWAAADAVGFPNVYPRFGDLTGTWAPARTSSARDVLSLSFNGARTREFWIFETFGVGGLYEVYDISDGTPVLLWRGVPGARRQLGAGAPHHPGGGPGDPRAPAGGEPVERGRVSRDRRRGDRADARGAAARGRREEVAAPAARAPHAT